jgi:hypothetical protein
MMRALALAIVVVAVSAAAVTAMEQPEAQLLLDLDLLREVDPRVQRDVPVARNVPLLELLERLNPPAAARGGGDKKPVPKGAC